MYVRYRLGSKLRGQIVVVVITPQVHRTNSRRECENPSRLPVPKLLERTELGRQAISLLEHSRLLTAHPDLVRATPSLRVFRRAGRSSHLPKAQVADPGGLVIRPKWSC